MLENLAHRRGRIEKALLVADDPKINLLKSLIKLADIMLKDNNFSLNRIMAKNVNIYNQSTSEEDGKYLQADQNLQNQELII